MHVLSDRIAALVLAGGGGSRLGGGKLLLPWRGRPILLHTVAAALELGSGHPLVVVTGYDAARARRILETASADPETPLRIVENGEWRDGLSTSLRLGVAEVQRLADSRAIQGVMILLGDQPRLRPETLRLLADAHLAACDRDPSHPATAPVFGERRGNPVVVSPSLFPEIQQLQGDTGARGILSRLGDAVLLVPVDDPGVVEDVDTPEDYASLPPDASR